MNELRAWLEMRRIEEKGKPIVTFIPGGKARSIPAGATILAAANQCGMSIGQSCGGEGICGWCKVTVVEGIEHMKPPSELEKKLIREKEFKEDERAACLAKVAGDVTITTSYW